MAFLTSLLGTIGQGIGSAASTVGQGIGSVFSSGKDAITQTSDPNAWRNVSYEAPPANAPGGQSGWGAIAKEAGKSVFKNLKSSDIPPGTKGLATKQSGKYTPGVVGPTAPQGIKAVKGMEQEAFTLDKATLEKLQKGLDERAKNRADLAGYNRESTKYPDLAPREDEETSWMKDIDQYYKNRYDLWSFME